MLNKQEIIQTQISLGKTVYKHKFNNSLSELEDGVKYNISRENMGSNREEKKHRNKHFTKGDLKGSKFYFPLFDLRAIY